ncbi:MAG: DUF4340 domain-containing protein, partial [Spirochaetales bacterium]|nr:DUF4340 domain-containing protein [Spirochaetales bacterium]
LPFMRNIKGLLMIQASPVNLYEETLKANNIKTNILFSSSKKSWKISENINLDNPTAIFPPGSPDQFQSYPLAVTLEGKFTSYFKGKPIPQKPKKEMDESEKQTSESGFITDEGVTDEINVIEQAQSPGRIFLVGTSEIIRDLILNYTPPGSLRDTSPNKILISNIIDYCNGKEDYAAMRSKLQLVNPLDETKTTPFAKDFTQYFNLIGLPVIAIICGIIVLLVRMGRKKKILLLFNPKGAAAAVSKEEMNQEKARVTTSVVSMGLKFTKDYLALVIIVGVLLGVLVWSNISRQMGVIQYKLPTLEQVQADTVNKMVVTRDDTIITLEKDKDAQWRIMPEGFPVDPAQIESMLGYVTDLKITELISKQKQYDRYELDEKNKINVQAYAGAALVRQMDIGKTSSTSSQTYVTLGDDPNIYSAKGNLKSLFDKDIAALRDKQVLKFSKDEVTEIILEFEGQSVVLGKQMIKPDGEDEAAAKPVWMANISDKPVSDTIVNDILTTMSGLVCEEFFTDTKKSDLEAQPFDYRITARGAKDYVLTIFNNKDDNKYPAYSSASDYAFKLIGWRATKMMKKLDDFKEKEQG